jgi:hypothetical protein
MPKSPSPQGTKNSRKLPKVSLTEAPDRSTRKSTRSNRRVSKDVISPVDGETRNLMIREAAYFRAERRGFDGNGELVDWLAAEEDIDRVLGQQVLQAQVAD